MINSDNELNQKLIDFGINHQEVLDTINKIADLVLDIPFEEIYSEARSLQLLGFQKTEKILILGNHSLVLYLILANLVNQVYISSNRSAMKKVIKKLKKYGYQNIILEKRSKIERSAPYQYIIVDQSKEMEPLRLIKLLQLHGTMVIKSVGYEKDVVKISKTTTGHLRENYGSKVLEAI